MPVLRNMFGAFIFYRYCISCRRRYVAQNQHGLCSPCQANVHQFVSMRRHLKALPLLQAAQNRRHSGLRLIEGDLSSNKQ
jgi:hypothetical protein